MSLATLLHQVFVLSPEGPYLLGLMESVHRLAPYSMIKQTLRISNAASMISGLTKLFLAKMSVGAMSNWIGLTRNADDGMNLLQRLVAFLTSLSELVLTGRCDRIISVTLYLDCSDFRKTASEKVEKVKRGPSKEHLAVIRKYINQPRAKHDEIRNTSIESRTSIIAAIFQDADPKLLQSLTEVQHEQCLVYLSSLLSIRDREEITRVLCRQTPDLFTQIIRDSVTTFEPVSIS
jgi:hypothetical protein